MTFPDDASAPAPATGPTPQMMPGARPGEAHAETVDPIDPELAESIPVRVRELLGQVDDIREQSGEAIDLVALARQTQLLEQAHEVLTSALSDVDRR
ncbi:hypothetical protein GPOL_c25960 [Gordonia polyisoprenivorans VH2]|uniref:Uncharacterized protein n=1 Tax=Gordonia polyisoprenivorans (strain DSM 44266 / VH2) TaxID=1112204 RepID=H6N4P0_GORPV|nr:hypothetical protein [Gordonia polyisoprenivorans]AFA73622.1 hypothetical protein GPOL_c25960 [Gordonia polyisoprenivorans VH2]